jgi:4-aminobutyrate aminotransferase
MKNADINQRRINASPRGIGVMCNFYAAKAENSTVWDVEGNQYTDFAAGIAVLNTGHRHPALVQAMKDQLDCFTHTAYQIIPYESSVHLAERINAIAPIDGAKKTAFFTTGAESVENAIKIARASTGRAGVIAFAGGFHGRTLLGMALTGKVVPYKVGFGPFPSDIFHVPFPSEVHGITTDDSIHAIEKLFKADIDPARVAAIIIEPIQGEGGFYVAPNDLMVKIRQICDQHGIVMIADEVQTGYGRTGKLFAMEHYTVKPDLVTLAKSLAGGMPLSAVCGRASIMDAPAPGGLGGTYAGNPLAVASAHAVLDVITKENLLVRSEALGAQLRQSITALNNPNVSEVRGLGSMSSVEFKNASTGAPSPEIASQVQKLALEKGLLLLTCGVYGNVIRFLYPLTIPQAQFDEALTIINQSIQSAG